MKHILVVDDEMDGADMLAILLELEGYSVETASDGRECMAKIAARRPDLVILDLMMPAMSGWDVLVLLELEGYSVETASDGRECMAKIAARRPDLVILDLMMPAMSGWDVLEALRRDPPLRTIPVIVCSAARAEEAGSRYGHASVSKPIEIDALRRIVSELLREG